MPIAFLAALALLTPGAAAAAAPGQLAVARIRSQDTVGIVLTDAAGHHRRTLTSHNGWQDDDPAWSPEGASIAFSRTTDGSRSIHVFVMRADGTHVHRLTRGRFDERPAWSPDGRWIAYQALSGIRLIHPDGRGGRTVPGTRGAAWPAWTPDGRLAFTQDGVIWLARRDGSRRERIVRGREPDVSPDGFTLVYTRPNGGVATRSVRRDAHVQPIGPGLQPAWGPDARRIAFTRWPASGRFSVWTMRRDGSVRQLVLRDARSPAWRPSVPSAAGR